MAQLCASSHDATLPIRPFDPQTCIWISPEMPAAEVVRRLHQQQIDCILVLNDRTLVGTVTERDLVRLLAWEISLNGSAIAALSEQPIQLCQQELDSLDIATLLKRFSQYSVSYLPVVDRQQQIIGIVTQDDVYQQLLESEAKLRHSEERYRQALENSPNPIFSIDRQGMIQSWNAACEHIFQYGQDICGQNIIVLMPDLQAAHNIAQRLNDAFEGQSFSNIETTFQCRDRSLRVMTSRLFPIRDEKGEIDRCIFANTDITERVRVEQERQQVEATLKQQTQHIQELNADLENQVQQRTAQLQKSLKFEELLKQITVRVRDSLDESQILTTAVQSLAEALQTFSCDTGLYDLEQGTSTVCYEHIRSRVNPAQGKVAFFADHPEIYRQLCEGQPVHYCWTQEPKNPMRSLLQQYTTLACPLIDDQGVMGDMWLYKPSHSYFEEAEIRLVQQVANHCAIALRQSRLYQATQAQVEALEHLNRLKDDFLSTISHELRTPIANMKLATEMLEISLERLNFFKTTPSSQLTSIQRFFQILKEECQRETLLINNLLDLSQLNAGTEPLILSTVELPNWVSYVAEPFLERIAQQQKTLQFSFSEELPLLTTDFSYLERIFTELLHNACKYTPTGETIRISGWAVAHHVYLSVANSGIEISPEEQPRVFDRFYRIIDHDPWRHDGTGLGLALVKKRVEHIHGTVELTSTAGWTTFTLKLPQLQENNGSENAIAQLPLSLSAKTVGSTTRPNSG